MFYHCDRLINNIRYPNLKTLQKGITLEISRTTKLGSNFDLLMKPGAKTEELKVSQVNYSSKLSQIIFSRFQMCKKCGRCSKMCQRLMFWRCDIFLKWCESRGPGYLVPRRNEPDFVLYFFVIKVSELKNSNVNLRHL